MWVLFLRRWETNFHFRFLTSWGRYIFDDLMNLNICQIPLFLSASFKLYMGYRVIRLAFRLTGNNWLLSPVKHECACVCPQHLTGQVLLEMNNVLENSESASEGSPVLRSFSLNALSRGVWLFITLPTQFHPQRTPQINLSEFVFRAAHNQRSLPHAEEFPNTRHYCLTQWFHLATRPAQSVSSTYFVNHW